MRTNIYINSFNRLTTLKTLVEQCLSLKGAGTIYIVDNHSSYLPLLEWLAGIRKSSIANRVQVICLGHNAGPRAAFYKANEYEDQRFVITDPDLDLDNCPIDLISVLHSALDEFRQFDKAGPSLRIDDIPEHSQIKDLVLAHESKFWEKPLNDKWFEADIDTTFCLCNPKTAFSYKACRSNKPYQIRHVPFYCDPTKLSEEEKQYYRLLPKERLPFFSWSGLLRERAVQNGTNC